jgi:hypothetical protein
MTTVFPALDNWIEGHPFLKDVARLQLAIEDALNTDESTSIPVLQWDSLAVDFAKGIPFFRNRELDEAVVTRAAELFGRLAQDLGGWRKQSGASPTALSAVRSRPWRNLVKTLKGRPLLPAGQARSRRRHKSLHQTDKAGGRLPRLERDRHHPAHQGHR